MVNLSNNITGDAAVEAAVAILAVLGKYEGIEIVNPIRDEIRRLSERLADVNTKVMYDHNVRELSRDINRLYACFRGTVKCGLMSSDAEVRSAAETAKAVCEASRDIPSLGMVKKSGALVAFLTDLQEPLMRSAVSKLPGLPECVSEMESAWQRLSAGLSSHLDQVTSSRSVKASEVKRELITLINGSLIAGLTGLAVFEPARYQGVLDEVTGIARQFNEMYRSRRKSVPSA